MRYHEETWDATVFWIAEQKCFHINYKELFAVKLALENLAVHHWNCRIQLRVDGTTPITYVNRMGGIRYKSYNKLTEEICQWAKSKKIFLFVSYIASEKK